MRRAERADGPARVTVLHLADVQFGVRQRPAEGLTERDRQLDGLAARLLTDLAEMREQHDLKPDLVVIAGDLAEWAMPAEYEQAYGFLTELARELDLSPDRFVIVPGNHDLNRKRSEAYFLTCEADGTKPVAPYWPKWEPYAAMYTRFTGQAFPQDQPWTYHEIGQLKVAVAGLNSTMADSHRDEDHHGWVGDAQLRFFAEKMADARRRGWLRLAVVHHNPIRAPLADDANLQDADRLDEILAPHLHLLLHGHTHDARIHHLGAGALPVLCAGSAGVVDGERPPGVPTSTT